LYRTNTQNDSENNCQLQSFKIMFSYANYATHKGIYNVGLYSRVS